MKAVGKWVHFERLKAATTTPSGLHIPGQVKPVLMAGRVLSVGLVVTGIVRGDLIWLMPGAPYTCDEKGEQGVVDFAEVLLVETPEPGTIVEPVSNVVQLSS